MWNTAVIPSPDGHPEGMGGTGGRWTGAIAYLPKQQFVSGYQAECCLCHLKSSTPSFSVVLTLTPDHWRHDVVEGTLNWDSRALGSNPESSITDSVCDLGPIISLLWDSVSPSIKWGGWTRLVVFLLPVQYYSAMMNFRKLQDCWRFICLWFSTPHNSGSSLSSLGPTGVLLTYLLRATRLSDHKGPSPSIWSSLWDGMLFTFPLALGTWEVIHSETGA